ncbi:rod shape-determining protein MreC [Clostridium sp. NSJ-49]|uniref:Cell shape-determining protein MreC n=1 Tax=Clostridium disporicum TaxID=84024 RepID=A0A174FKB4_9CLOT|nr:MULTISPECIES: rod shape-determining protein MreC [Clostridium]MBC5624353.1 rod shape-determining protein MreC [Clostridium sp. NSJ-49]MCD2501550.1 rod shape-determining protein MreC [Clostridium sp. NSJ-145]CUO49049.1 rod shape-determining protein MreC [Clostridium disporicum]
MKPFKNKLAVTIIVLSVTFLGIIIFSVKNGSDSISSGIGAVVSPLQKIVYKANDKLKSSVEFFVNFSKVKQENEELKIKNSELENQMIEYKALKDENERLREVLNFKENKNNYDYIGVNIIGYSGGTVSNGYIIDKGTNDGVEKDMIIINYQGLVGKVTKAESNYSIVETILNENMAVSVMVDSTRETTGILRGYKENKNEDLVKVYNLPIDSEIKEGDVILTSGLGMIYPKEIRIGEVVSVETDNVMVMKNALVKPYVDFNKLEELFIVVPKDKVNVKYD